ncbi:MAG: hypothetical protein H7A35_01780 [Planctomycetales bacterium]|nr:hypothetical protein [bacterium]UNM08788.1 MAG: hypothetical protein H7A35_01780 [Planctomycetales bacterium]
MPLLCLPLLFSPLYNFGTLGWLSIFNSALAIYMLLVLILPEFRRNIVPATELAEIRRLARVNLLDHGLLLKAMAADCAYDMHAPGSIFNPAGQQVPERYRLRNIQARMRALMDHYAMACESHGWPWKAGQDDSEQMRENMNVEGMELKTLSDLGSVMAMGKYLASSMHVKSPERLAILESLLAVLEEQEDG